MKTLELRELDKQEMESVNGGRIVKIWKYIKKGLEYIGLTAALHDAWMEIKNSNNECRN